MPLSFSKSAAWRSNLLLQDTAFRIEKLTSDVWGCFFQKRWVEGTQISISQNGGWSGGGPSCRLRGRRGPHKGTRNSVHKLSISLPRMIEKQGERISCRQGLREPLARASVLSGPCDPDRLGDGLRRGRSQEFIFFIIKRGQSY